MQILASQLERMYMKVSALREFTFYGVGARETQRQRGREREWKWEGRRMHITSIS